MSDLDLNQLFPFPLDDFQQDAIAALNAGKSAIVCAPTGSGKTLIGEYAIYRALANEQRVFYTTPLKALSNQKNCETSKSNSVPRMWDCSQGTSPSTAMLPSSS